MTSKKKAPMSRKKAVESSTFKRLNEDCKSKAEIAYEELANREAQVTLHCSTMFECEAFMHIPVALLQDYRTNGFVLVCSDCRQVPDIALSIALDR